MNEKLLSIADYPLAEKRPEIVRGKRGKGLDEITLEALLEDRVTLEDLRITDAALRQQAEIARAAGETRWPRTSSAAPSSLTCRKTRSCASTSCCVPAALNRGELLAAARSFASNISQGIAAFVEEAAAVYERRACLKSYST